MTYHILNGDALTDRFIATGIGGEILVCRECLVDGPLRGNSLNDFFDERANYLSGSSENEKYYNENVRTEFERISRLPVDAEVNLWFGYDLFCMANMLFILSLLQEKGSNRKIYIVYPSHLARENRWKDFGGATVADLQTCFARRILLNEKDISFAAGCWKAFKNNDLVSFQKLTANAPGSFHYMEEVGQAHLERFPANNNLTRPERVITEIISEKDTKDFAIIFPEFFQREGIYGFGDTQVKQIYDKVLEAGNV